MPNHLTPEELSREFGIERAEVIRICVEEHVPVYHGRIDKTLFDAVRHIHEPQQVHATVHGLTADHPEGRSPRPLFARPDATLVGCASVPGVRSCSSSSRWSSRRRPRERLLRPPGRASARLSSSCSRRTPRSSRARDGARGRAGPARARARRAAQRARAPRRRAQQPARLAARARAAAQRDLPRAPARHAGRPAGVALVRRHQRGPRPARPPLARGRLARPLRPPLALGARGPVAHAAHGRAARAGRAGRVGGARRRPAARRRAPSARCSGACGASTCAR